MSWEAAAIAANAAMNAIGSTVQSGAMNRRAARVARETNALNYKMFQEGNAFNERMFNEANKWNSPVNQRKMLQEAGYNPAMLFDANIGAANPVSSASANAAQGYTPNAPDYSQIGMNAIQSFLALKQADKLSAETENQKIKNLYEADTLSSALALQAAQTGNLNSLTTGQEIQNEINDNTKNWQEENIRGKAVEQLHKASIADFQQQQEEMKAKVLQKYGMQKGEQELKNLQKEYDVLAAKEGTEFAQQYMYKKTGDAAWLNAKTSQAVGVSQINANNATAANQLQQASEAEQRTNYQKMVNKVYETFGPGKAAAEFIQLVNQGKLTDAQAMKTFYEAHQKEATWKWDAANQLVKDLIPLMPSMGISAY